MANRSTYVMNRRPYIVRLVSHVDLGEVYLYPCADGSSERVVFC